MKYTMIEGRKYQMKSMKQLLFFVIFLLLVSGAGNQAFSDSPILRMATTTSTDNTGFLDYLAPLFKADTGIELQWVAVGTGKALKLGQNCDVDILMVHAPNAEKAFVKNGYGINRHQFMYNDFVIIGPAHDPAGIKGKSVSAALNSIYVQNPLFLSRGDDSGTNKKEILLWKGAGLQVPDRESWYIQTGQGMLHTIVIAEEQDAYTLTDRGTFIKYESNWKGNPYLNILIEGDQGLRNQYSVIAINPAQCGNVKRDLAAQFIRWIVSPEVQKHIADFRLMGKQLFIPNASENED